MIPIELVEMDSACDHVHLLINYPPKLAVSNLVNSLKGVSGRLLRRERPDITQRYYYNVVLWKTDYYAGRCGGAPISNTQYLFTKTSSRDTPTFIGGGIPGGILNDGEENFPTRCTIYLKLKLSG